MQEGAPHFTCALLYCIAYMYPVGIKIVWNVDDALFGKGHECCTVLISLIVLLHEPCCVCGLYRNV